MIVRFPITKTLTILTFATFASAIINGQYKNLYPTWENLIFDILEQKCANLTVHNGPNGYGVVHCILENFTEVRKAEMAICSVILGLLPVALQFVGPKVSDISTLAMQRPILAFLITLGSPCATLEHERTGLEPHPKTEGLPLWPKFLLWPPVWIKCVLSFLEYGIVMLAAVNAILQGYQLTFWAVALVSTITGTFGNTLEAFSPLLWVFLGIPIHILGLCALRLCEDPAEEPRTELPSSLLSMSTICGNIRKWITQELTPCAFSDNAVNRPIVLKPSYSLLILNWMIKLLVWVDVIYGVIVLSSILFLSLFDTLEVIGKYLAGSAACRVVLAFEVYGLREDPRREGTANRSSHPSGD